MNDQTQHQLPEESHSTPHTPQLDTEQEAAPPAAEVVDKPSPKQPAKSKPQKKADRVPPKVSGVFLGDEDRRLLKSMNKVMMKKLGIRPNSSRVV